MEIIIGTIGLFITCESFGHWRRGVKGCLFYLPFAGVVSLYFYPSKLPLLFKDLFFLLPAYMGFLLVRKKIFHPEILVSILSLFFGLVIIQLFNPNLLNLFIGLIGLKVWLFYIPLFFLAYHFIDSEERLVDLSKTLVKLALVPCIIGIVQAIFIYSGFEDYVYAIYGKAAGPATQQFARLTIGSGFLVRIPSTFTFVAQYFNFTLCMIPLAYAISQDAKNRKFGKLALSIIIIASLLSGARSAFLFVPFLLILIVGLHKGFHGIVSSIIVLGVIFLMVAAYLFGGIIPLWNHMGGLIIHYWNEVVVGLLAKSIDLTLFGMGTGMNTGPARHAFTDINNLPEGYVGMENYYAKAVYELGVIGLILLLLLFYVLITKGYKIHKGIKDKKIHAFSAGFLAYLVLMVVQSVKGWSLDLDPANVYFWFFAGILMKLKIIANKDKSYSILEQDKLKESK